MSFCVPDFTLGAMLTQKGVLALLALLLAAGTRGYASGHDAAVVVSAEELRAAGLSKVRDGIPFVDFDLESLQGGRVRLSSLKGSVVFLNFWATWCPPCREEMPSMERLYSKFAGVGLRIVAVDLQESRRDVEAFVREFGLTFQVLLDPAGQVGSAYGVRGLPTTFLINRDGLLVAGRIGGQEWDTPAVTVVLEKLLGR